MKQKFKAPDWFIELQNEIECLKKEVMDTLVEETGYGLHWCKKNFVTAIKKLSEEKQKGIYLSIDKAQIIKEYAWGKYYYENWDNIKNFCGLKAIASGSSYNSKSKKITLYTTSEFVKKINHILAKIKNGLSLH